MSAHGNLRRGFTLVELLVVVAIILALMAITGLFLQGVLVRNVTDQGAAFLSGQLLIARQMAKRDGIPTGLRFVLFTYPSSQPSSPQPQPPAGWKTPGTFCTQIQFIQQPDDYTLGQYTGGGPSSFTDPSTGKPYYQATFTPTFEFSNRTPYIVTAGSGAPSTPVPGDLLEIYGGGPIRQIAAVGMNGNIPILYLSGNSTPLSTSSVSVPSSGTSNYRLIFQPRPIGGDQTLPMPAGSAIDFTAYTNQAAVNNNGTTALSNVASRSGVIDSNGTLVVSTFYEILFAPSGTVISQGSYAATAPVNPGTMQGTGINYFWVRDPTVDMSSGNQPLQTGNPQIIAVYPRTGFIAGHPVSSSGDPYAYVKDGQSSGM
jgi:prepilin-type N-terminal cleavage/methylation domain-containing protein